MTSSSSSTSTTTLSKSSSQQDQQPPQQEQQQQQQVPPMPLSPTKYATRTQIRRAVHTIILRILRQRLASEGNPHQPGAVNNPHQPPANRGLRLNKAQRFRARQQAQVLEDILYRRASSLEDYQKLSNLEERVYKAGRAVYINAHRREMERESRRRVLNENSSGNNGAVESVSAGGNAASASHVVDPAAVAGLEPPSLRRAESV